MQTNLQRGNRLTQALPLGIAKAHPRAFQLAFLSLAVLCCGCAQDVPQSQPLSNWKSKTIMNIQNATDTSTTAILDRNMKAFATRNVDALMENYADDAVLIAQDAAYRGKAEIRVFFEKLVGEFNSPQTTFALSVKYVNGPIAFIAWTAETPLRRYELGTDTFYVADGRIVYQTYAFKSASK
jgi:ketosteroid isomerase-like protein